MDADPVANIQILLHQRLEAPKFDGVLRIGLDQPDHRIDGRAPSVTHVKRQHAIGIGRLELYGGTKRNTALEIVTALDLTEATVKKLVDFVFKVVHVRSLRQRGRGNPTTRAKQ